MAAPPRTLTWKHFSEVAEELFKVFGRSELVWAQQMWEHLVKAGLCTADSELDRCRVCIRFIALACIYRDFCSLAWKKRLSPHFHEWAVYLDLHPLRLGQLLGTNAALPEARRDDELVHAAVQVLANRERPQLHRALVQAVSSPSRLFITMWRTREHLPGTPGAARDKRESDDQILNDLSFEKIDAYEYVSKGFVTAAPPPGV
ncbi:MAG TPA: hypothetical protein P5234_13425 [Thermoanaerobaculaceae bacterium]|nr:hypothetical protein [Thermoanaerobaculaceae bacterium]HRS17234.1 hypothetical protein [Thermoanaerobaculaceae bacterium]